MRTSVRSLNSILLAWPAIAFAGIVSSGIAYTLQIVGQKEANPSHAAIIFSLEGAFAAIGGILFLNESLTAVAMLGCVVLFLAMLVSQGLFKFRAKRAVVSP